MANENTSGRIGFVGLLTVLFVALKLMGYITWSWVWVLAPIWISAITSVALLAFALLVFIWAKD